MDRLSEVWRHFSRSADEKAICSICQKCLCIKGSSTSGLIRHLKSIHQITVKRKGSEDRTIVKNDVEEKQPSSRGSADSKTHKKFSTVFVEEGDDAHMSCNSNYDALDDDLFPTPKASTRKKSSDTQMDLIDIMREIGDDIREQRINMMETDQELLGFERKRLKLMQEYVKYYKKQTDTLHQYLRK